MSATLAKRIETDGPIWLVGLGHGATHWVIALFYFVLPYLSEDLGLSYTEAGLFAAIFQVASLSANVVSGPVVDITGRRVFWQAVSLSIGGMALFLMGLSSSYLLLAVLMLFIGSSNNLWHPAAISYLSIRYPDRRGFALSIHALGANLGDAVAPVLMAPVLAWLSWRETLEGGALVPIVDTLLLLIFLRRTGKRADAQAELSVGIGSYFKGVGRLARDRSVLILCFMSAFRNVAQIGLLVFLPLYLAHDIGLGPAELAWTLFAFQAAGIAAAPIAGLWSDRVGRRPVVMAGLGVTTAALLALTFVSDPLLYVAGVSVMGFALFAVRPVVHSWLMDMTPPEMGGSATSLLFGIQSALTVFSPLIGGALADEYGLLAAFYFLAVAMLVANLLVVFLPKAR